MAAHGGHLVCNLIFAFPTAVMRATYQKRSRHEASIHLPSPDILEESIVLKKKRRNAAQVPEESFSEVQQALHCL